MIFPHIVSFITVIEPYTRFITLLFSTVTPSCYLKNPHPMPTQLCLHLVSTHRDFSSWSSQCQPFYSLHTRCQSKLPSWKVVLYNISMTRDACPCFTHIIVCLTPLPLDIPLFKNSSCSITAPTSYYKSLSRYANFAIDLFYFYLRWYLQHLFIHGYSLFIIFPLFLFVWVLCNPLLHDWALCSLLFFFFFFFLGTMYPVICYWELCIPLSVIGNYASHYLLLGTMHPAIYYWVLCDRLFYYILGTMQPVDSLLY